MNAAQLDSEIADIRSDILSLQSELKNLEAEKTLLASELQLLQSEAITIEEEDESAIENRHGKSKTVDNYNSEIPEIIRHEHFDASISRFFQPGTESESTSSDANRKRLKVDRVTNDILAKAERLVDLKENILYENIFRLAGVTAFPINKYLLNPEDEIFGIRFDMFAHTKRVFLSPHYAILRKVAFVDKEQATVKKWTLYRHTLPVYLPIEELKKQLENSNEQQAITEFALSVRDYLTKIQYKSDKLESLLSLTLESLGVKGSKPKRIITNIDKDLKCERVKFTVLNRNSLTKKPHQIELLCNDNTIEVAKIDLVDVNGKKNHALICESILKDSAIEDLLKNFRKVFHHMIQNQLL
ncbi:minichromosome maintenance protein [Scheffersomyces xylosifermentans]|uniref:minichromosome maintenance protein n=1 Tax=Scheffersomyces xylosifermentans TaxID=1304137 RepID=UPI00315DE1ED